MSQTASRTLKQAPADEVAKNAQLLIKAGYIHKEMAGVYDFLPLGLMVLQNIIAVIRSEMNRLGAEELLMTTLQRPETWAKTNEWDDKVVDIWFKSKLKNGSDIGLAYSHEAALTAMMKNFISSRRDLPRAVYQFQTKLRNETRAKSGILRTREFIMKDLYSFSRDQAEHEEFYEKAKAAYANIFDQLGIGDKTFLTFASGGSFAPFSHEFQTLTDAGEDTIYLSRDKNIAINKEVLSDQVMADLGLQQENLEEHTAAEVGNIFNLGTKYSDSHKLVFTNQRGETQPVIMGSYGIGPARVMGVIAELTSDENGLVWPENIAPYKYHLVVLGEEVKSQADDVYERLKSADKSILYDDRDISAGEKFADADLIGIPNRLVISPKTEGKIELKSRTGNEVRLVELSELLS